MKQLIIAFSSLFIALAALSQTSSGTWNSRTATYTNTKYGITWQLFDDWQWVGRPILSESTLFKVRCDEAHVLVNLGVTKSVAEGGDIWNHVSDFESPEMTELIKLTAKRNGMTYLGTKAIKSQLNGIHAVKVRSDMKKHYPEYNQTVHGIEVTYNLYKNGNVFTATVTALSVLEEEIGDFDRVAAMIFNGLIIK